MKTWHLGLIGRDIGHSLTPALHRALFAASGLPGDSRLLDTADLEFGLALLRSGELDGLCVTTPHKVAAARQCQSWSAAGPQSAVNTLYMCADALSGASTDGPGLSAALGHLGVPLDLLPRVWLLGSGGASLSIADHLGRAGCEVLVTARDLQRDARAFTEVGAVVLAVGVVAQDADVVLHASRWGHGQGGELENLDPTWQWLPWAAWRQRPPWIGDIVYSRTGLTWFERRCAARLAESSEARRAAPKLMTQLGLSMLAAQAAASFELWTGEQVAWQRLMPAIAPATHAATKSTSG